MSIIDLTTFHKFDPENYEKEVYEVLTFASKKIPAYPNDGKLTNLLDGTEIPINSVYLVKIATEVLQGVAPTYST